MHHALRHHAQFQERAHAKRQLFGFLARALQPPRHGRARAPVHGREHLGRAETKHLQSHHADGPHVVRRVSVASLRVSRVRSVSFPPVEDRLSPERLRRRVLAGLLRCGRPLRPVQGREGVFVHRGPEVGEAHADGQSRSVGRRARRVAGGVGFAAPPALLLRLFLAFAPERDEQVRGLHVAVAYASRVRERYALQGLPQHLAEHPPAFRAFASPEPPRAGADDAQKTAAFAFAVLLLLVPRFVGVHERREGLALVPEHQPQLRLRGDSPVPGDELERRLVPRDVLASRAAKRLAEVRLAATGATYVLAALHQNAFQHYPLAPAPDRARAPYLAEVPARERRALRRDVPLARRAGPPRVCRRRRALFRPRGHRVDGRGADGANEPCHHSLGRARDLHQRARARVRPGRERQETRGDAF
mmetsp:Transcript_2475/g.9683  ORF Transcript_2475/g.9683 Transcript_2475/m.9683 type:complete len:418 (+) Transcript_2475:358-1611(+)